MITPVENLVEDLEQKTKIITYLKTMYKDKTGEEAFIPDEAILEKNKFHQQVESNVPNGKFQFFKDKVNALNLPNPNDKDAKNRIEKLRRKKDTSVLIKNLDISYFKGKDMSPELLKRVIEGIKILKSVEFVNLSHNALSDNYLDIIIEFMLIPNVKKVDISYNNLSKACVKRLVACIKNLTKLEYIDVSYNPFCRDEVSCVQLCAAVKGCDKLEHFGICDASKDSGIKILAHKPLLKTLILEDSRYKKKTFDTIGKFLSNKKYELKELSLKFCRVDFLYGAMNISRGLRRNKFLLELNLYGTSLSDIAGKLIVEALYKNPILRKLNLGQNYISTESCISIGKLLKINGIIDVIDISKNYKIINENFFYILNGLVDNNNLKSLGDLFETKIGVKYRESAENLLLLNNNFGDWRLSNKIKRQKKDFYDSNVKLDEFDIQEKERQRDIEREEKTRKLNEAYPTKKEEQSRGMFGISQSQSVSPRKDLFRSTVSMQEKDNQLIQSRILKESIEYNKDINTIIQPLNPNKKNYGVFIKSQAEKLDETYGDFMQASVSQSLQLQGQSKSNESGINVPFSIPGSNFIEKSKEDYKKAMEDTKKGKKKPSPSKTSRSKGKKAGSPRKGKEISAVNYVASYTQEVINGSPEFSQHNTKIVNDKKRENREEMQYIQFKNNIPYAIDDDDVGAYQDSGINNYELGGELLNELNKKFGVIEANEYNEEEDEQSIFNTYLA